MKNNIYSIIFYPISHWHSKSLRLCFACWPHCQSVLAGRIYPTHTKKSLFFVGIPTCLPLRRNGRGTSSDVLVFG